MCGTRVELKINFTLFHLCRIEFRAPEKQTFGGQKCVQLIKWWVDFWNLITPLGANNLDVCTLVTCKCIRRRSANRLHTNWPIVAVEWSEKWAQPSRLYSAASRCMIIVRLLRTFQFIGLTGCSRRPNSTDWHLLRGLRHYLGSVSVVHIAWPRDGAFAEWKFMSSDVKEHAPYASHREKIERPLWRHFNVWLTLCHIPASIDNNDIDEERRDRNGLKHISFSSFIQVFWCCCWLLAVVAARGVRLYSWMSIALAAAIWIVWNLFLIRFCSRAVYRSPKLQY